MLRRRTVLRLGAGAALATATMAVVGHWTLEPTVLEADAPEIGLQVPIPRSVARARREGWGTTTYGTLGIPGIPIASNLKTPLAILFGDSYVQSHQVDDSDKLAVRFTSLAPSFLDSPWVMAGVGRPYRSFADYPHLIRVYEDALPQTRLIVILAVGLRDTLPDEPRSERASVFRSRPTLALEWFEREGGLAATPSPATPRRRLLARLPLEFPFHLKRLVAGQSALRWSLGTARWPPPQPSPLYNPVVRLEEGDHGRYDQAWDFLLENLRASTSRPIVVLYAPETPRIESGTIVWRNPEELAARRFAALCERHQIGFLDAGPALVRDQLHSGQFARGFSNSFPGYGHFNARGLDLLARTLIGHLAAHRDDLLPN